MFQLVFIKCFLKVSLSQFSFGISQFMLNDNTIFKHLATLYKFKQEWERTMFLFLYRAVEHEDTLFGGFGFLRTFPPIYETDSALHMRIPLSHCTRNTYRRLVVSGGSQTCFIQSCRTENSCFFVRDSSDLSANLRKRFGAA